MARKAKTQTLDALLPGIMFALTLDGGPLDGGDVCDALATTDAGASAAEPAAVAAWLTARGWTEHDDADGWTFTPPADAPATMEATEAAQ
jgi:hypothetical protein